MTPTLAATSPPPGTPWGLLVALAAVAILGYTLSCWCWPFTACGRCTGTGKKTRADGKVWRPCRRCKGTGRRLRIGRRLYNHFATKRDGAQ